MCTWMYLPTMDMSTRSHLRKIYSDNYMYTTDKRMIYWFEQPVQLVTKGHNILYDTCVWQLSNSNDALKSSNCGSFNLVRLSTSSRPQIHLIHRNNKALLLIINAL